MLSPGPFPIARKFFGAASRHFYCSKNHQCQKNFTIPSIHDDTTLDCRLYHPKQQPESDLLDATKAAIVAHPYAPLGGCYDDPVVASIGKVLLKAGYIVGTFNFRYFSQKQPYQIL